MKAVIRITIDIKRSVISSLIYKYKYLYIKFHIKIICIKFIKYILIINRYKETSITNNTNTFHKIK